jgi:Stage II sporulation protein E (SpoIIE)
VREIVEVIPTPIKWLLAALAAFSVVLGGSSLLATIRARRMRRERERLLDDAGALQAALLPVAPSDLEGLTVSVAYRPADGPAAGGDFYDVFALEDGRAAIVLGDVCGHGRAALGRTALVRHTIRAYLAAGLEPRRALQLTSQVVTGWGDGEFATAAAAVYDASEATLTYACAGHPPPVTAGSLVPAGVLGRASPPLGLEMPTGLRQTTIPLGRGSVVCFHTDGLTDAKTGDGVLGDEAVTRLVETLPPEASADDLLDRIQEEADTVSDDMAACLVRPLASSQGTNQRIEEFEIDAEGRSAETFLVACGVESEEALSVSRAARRAATRAGSAVLRVVISEHGRPRVEFAAGEAVGDAHTGALSGAPGR